MRIYVKKINDGFVIYDETTTQSVISDILTMLVIIVLFTIYIIVSKIIGHTVVIDIVISVILLLYLFTSFKRKEKILNKEQLHDLIDKL